MTEKLCVNCKHCMEDIWVDDYVCTYRETEQTNLVTGEKQKLGRVNCFIARHVAGGMRYDPWTWQDKCGPEGKYFEAKPKDEDKS